MSYELKVKLLGQFDIAHGDNSLADSINRSKKLWCLIAYLIFNHSRVIKQNELIDVLWGGNASSANPSGALKTLLFRARAELDSLWEGAGHDLIVSSSEGYSWNNSCVLKIDSEELDELANAYSPDTEESERLEKALRILRLYRGDFLKQFYPEFWIMPVAAHYLNIFLATLSENYEILIKNGYSDEVERFFRIASESDPFNEELHRMYMQALILSDNKKAAMNVYQSLNDRLLSELGIFPSEETRSLYHQIINSTNEHIISADMLLEQLRENGDSKGALVCDYDFFRVLYYSMARSVLRSGIAVHIALLSISEKDQTPLPQKKLQREMENLRCAIKSSLRRGDSASKCSVSQYVVMLPGANYENSCMVCKRIIKQYNQTFSYPDVDVRFEVRAIEPDKNSSVPFFAAKLPDQ